MRETVKKLDSKTYNSVLHSSYCHSFLSLKEIFPLGQKLHVYNEQLSLVPEQVAREKLKMHR